MHEPHVVTTLLASLALWAAIQSSLAMGGPTNEQRIAAALEQRGAVSVEDKTISQLADYLREKTGASVVVDRTALDAVGIDLDKTRVSGRFPGISLGSALRHMLHDLELTWTIRDGALAITTPEAAEEQLLTVAYQVRDLLLPPSSVREDLSARYFDSRSLRDWCSWYDFDSLFYVIEGVVAPESWEAVGGPGAMEAFGHTLTVSQTLDVHRRIEHLLAAIRQGKELSRKCCGQAPPIASISVDGRANRRVYESLQVNFDFDFTDTPLKDVASFFQERIGVPVLLDRSALEAIGLTDRTHVRFISRGLTAGQALRLVLRELELTWIVRDEALVITTPEEGEECLEVRVYPVGDLLSYVRPRDPLAPGKGKDFDMLTDLIETTIELESWEAAGGPGAMEPFPNANVLVVSQSPKAHEEIEQLLTRLRAELAPRQSEPAKSTKKPASSGSRPHGARAAEADRDGAVRERDLRFVVYFVPSPVVGPPQGPHGEKKEPKADGDASPPGGSTSSGTRPTQRNLDGLGGMGVYRPESPPIPTGQLLEIIRELVEPDGWVGVPGVYARAAPGRLMIRHTAAVHRRIHALLSQLRIEFHISGALSEYDDGQGSPVSALGGDTAHYPG